MAVRPRSVGRAPSEAAVQRAIVSWLRLHERRGALQVLHVPNGGSRGKVEAARFQGLGVAPGAPDLAVLLPDGRMLWLEVKAAKGRLSETQRDWHARARLLGHAVVVVRDLAEAQRALAEAGLAGIGSARGAYSPAAWVAP